MESEARVPPAVTVAFERLALSICEEAKLDFSEWASKTHELVGHLQELWREGVELGLNTDASEARALELFGTMENVGKALRPPWIRRYLFLERYRGQRYAMFMTAAVVSSYFGAVRMILSSPGSYEVGSVQFFYLLGTSLNGACSLGALAAIQWAPRIRSRLLKCLFACRWILVPFVLTGLFNVVWPVLIALPQAMVRVISTRSVDEMLIMECAAAITGALGAAGYLSELIKLPARRSRRLQRQLTAALPT